MGFPRRPSGLKKIDFHFKLKQSCRWCIPKFPLYPSPCHNNTRQGRRMTTEFKEQFIDAIEQRCLKMQPFKDLSCSIHILITINHSFTRSLYFSLYSTANISYVLSASNQKHTMEISIQTAPSVVLKENSNLSNLLNQLFSRSFAVTHLSCYTQL